MNPKAVPAVMIDGGCEMITRWVAGAGTTVIGPVVTEESPSAVACKVYPDAAISVVMKAWKLATPPTALTMSGPLRVALPGLFSSAIVTPPVYPVARLPY